MLLSLLVVNSKTDNCVRMDHPKLSRPVEGRRGQSFSVASDAASGRQGQGITPTAEPALWFLEPVLQRHE